jgi:glutaminyl-tRNA synthetase
MNPAPNSPKQKEEQMENSSPNPSFSICDIRIQKQMSRSFGKSFPQKIALPKLRPHCSATCPNTWRAEHQRKMSFPFSKEIYIEREDFREEANRKFFRLKLGNEVRLKNAYIIKAESCTKDAEGNIIEIQCTYDVDSKSGSGTEASLRKVKGTLHWVSVAEALPIEVRIYDRLFSVASPDTDKEKDFMEFLNKESLEVIKAYAEPSLKERKVGENVQFQRLGYFTVDPDSTEDNMVFNRTVPLRDSWAKVAED